MAAEIRAERARAQMLQDDVAEAADMAPSTYMRLEKGERVTDVSQLRRLAVVFGTSAARMVANAEANVNAEADPVEAPKRTAYPQRPRTAGNAKASKKANVSTRQSP